MNNLIIESAIAQSLDGLLDAGNFTLEQRIACLVELGELFACLEGVIDGLNIEECELALLVGLLRLHKMLGALLKAYSPKKHTPELLKDVPQLTPKQVSEMSWRLEK